MLRELLEARLTPASRDARRQGYVYESVAFAARARRNRGAWAGHWQNCQDLVRDYCARHLAATSLTILGSGCLFEVPKDFLPQRFGRIVLVDKVFPRDVRAWARRQRDGQVVMKELDLADTQIPPAKTAQAIDTDLVFSANLLSQIALKELMRVGENDELRRRIEQSHLDALSHFAGRTLLWTDTERVYQKPRSHEIVDRAYTVITDLPEPAKTWDWNLAPAPEWSRTADVILKMQGLML